MQDLGRRLAKLLRAAKGTSPVLVTGGLAQDHGLVDCLVERLAESGRPIEVLTHPRSVHAGAIGAALWGAFRRRKLSATTSPAPRVEPHPSP